MMNIDKNLSEVFDVAVVQEHDIITADGTVIPPDTNEEETDFQKVRSNMHNALEIGRIGTELAKDIAISTEDPKAIKALSEMMRVLVETNMHLMEIHEKRNRIKVKESGETEGRVVQNQQNNIFVGTTAELSKFVKDTINK